ncbi:translocation/assembly module TamB domain-containing protein [Rhizobium sp. ARZ01]|uniref:translocation/assembly module TamB domain-containing protein n=1 Tax=Rhizobium sp. ARZ01 TaxID=2769313 RepID=UPI00178629F9|nr:translocation/assembly module TamB domain-containing protein [Rhizobium sp. ARZ01]MBD9374873.1 translocation/assembly module TamB domain-containing protein [Rhizobium sp. ARZ01]
MSRFFKILQQALRYLGYVAALLVIAILGVVGFIGFTDPGARLAASFIEDATASSDTRIAITKPSGLLTGSLRAETITLSDREGAYAEIRDLAVDWSPLDLLFLQFNAQRVSAGELVVSRRPVPGGDTKTTSDSKPFSLPVTIQVDSVDIPSITLAEGVAGQEQHLRLSGSGGFDRQSIALNLALAAKDQPGISVLTDLIFNPGEDKLQLKADITEPPGGMLARALLIPGEPAVAVRLTGDGPLSAWAGRLTAALDGSEVLALDARHDQSTNNLHTVALKGGGTFEALLPPHLRPLFAGTTAIDVAAATNGSNLLRIERGLVTTGALSLNAAGTLQTTGENNLNIRLTGADGSTPIPIRWPLANGEFAANLYGLQLVASGPAEATAVNLNVNLASATAPQGRLESILLTASSADTNVSTKTGHASLSLIAERSAMSDPNLERLVGTPLKVNAALAFSPEQLKFDPVTIESSSIGGQISGSYLLEPSMGTASFKLFALPDVLPEAMASRVQGTIALEGEATIGAGGAMSLSNLQIKSSVAEATGEASLADGSLQAKLVGRLIDAGAFIEGGSGEIAFDATASGPTDGPNVQAKITSNQLGLAGRTLDDIAIDLNGKASATAPAGDFTLTASMNGQAIDVRSSVVSDAGQISVPTLEAVVGNNKLNGALTLGEGFMPDGTIRFDFPELATIATLAGQSATGDFAGTLAFTNTDGKGSLVIAATGTEIRRDTATIFKPALDATIEDLKAGAVSGTFSADLARVGENDLEAPVIAFTHSGSITGFNISGRYENAPLAIEGDVARHDTATVIALRTLDAAIAGLPLSLKEAASISILDGNITFDNLAINAGDGVIAISGSANPAGKSSLAVNLSGIDGPAEYRFPTKGGEAVARIEAAQLTLSGELKAAAISLAATVASAQVPQGTVSGIDIVATSDVFDLIGRRGNLKVGIQAGVIDLLNADANRLLQVPLNATASLSITPQRIDFSDAAIHGAGLNVKADGHFVPEDASAAAKVDASVAATALPPALSSRFDTPLQVTADVVRGSDGVINLQAFNLASGTIAAKGTAKLAGENLDVSVSGTLPDLGKLLADAKGRATFEATATGPLAALGVKARLDSSGAELAGRTLSDLVLTLNGTADRTAPAGNLTATGAIGGQPINVKSSVVSENGTISIPSIDAQIGENVLSGALKLDANFLPDGTVKFDLPDIGLLAAMAGQQAEGDLAGSASINTADGKTAVSIQASGSGITRDQLRIVQPQIDLKTADLRSLAISGIVRADAFTSGTNRVDALALSFTQQGPKTLFDLGARYDGAPLTVKGSVAQQQAGMTIGLDAFQATPRGIAIRLDRRAVLNVRGGAVSINDFTIRTGSGSIAVSGTAGENLGLAIRVNAVPASLANTFSAGLGAEGTIGGTVNAKGTAAAPQVNYALTWNNAATAQTRSAGVSPLTIGANGQFADNTVQVQTNLSGPNGLAFRGGGTAGVAGNMTLDLTFSGTLPFALLQGPLGQQGFLLTGNAAVELAVRGPAKTPSITGTITTSGSQLVDVRRNLSIENLTGRVVLDGRQAVIQQLTGRIATGGQISASGSVGILPGSNFPADLSIKLNDVTYVDGRLLTANLTGDLTIRGPLLAGPVLGGRIEIRKANITIPQRLPASLSEIDIKHRNAPADVKAMAAALRGDEGGGSGETRGIGLDLRIDAPSRIFVRGRGIDAELGGSLTLRGTSSSPAVSGGFDLRRGRLEILAKRLDFTSGHIGFTGGLVPTINFVATSSANATTINITIAGPANNPSVSFTSSPALPQDEILARLIFGRSMNNLSAFQIAQLAAAVADLAGGGSGGSLLSGLRSKLGIDDLDITTDSQGRAQVSAGKYLNERTYLELKQDPETGGGKAAINLDVGRGVKLRGEAGSNGAGAAGIFYEKEY